MKQQDRKEPKFKEGDSQFSSQVFSGSEEFDIYENRAIKTGGQQTNKVAQLFNKKVHKPAEKRMNKGSMRSGTSSLPISKMDMSYKSRGSKSIATKMTDKRKSPHLELFDFIGQCFRVCGSKRKHNERINYHSSQDDKSSVDINELEDVDGQTSQKRHTIINNDQNTEYSIGTFENR